jgi:hypothetical protein
MPLYCIPDGPFRAFMYAAGGPDDPHYVLLILHRICCMPNTQQRKERIWSAAGYVSLVPNTHQHKGQAQGAQQHICKQRTGHVAGGWVWAATGLDGAVARLVAFNTWHRGNRVASGY